MHALSVASSRSDHAMAGLQGFDFMALTCEAFGRLGCGDPFS